MPNFRDLFEPVTAENEKANGKAKGRESGRRKAKCPMCGRPVEKTYRPFCSRRCADADLSRWFSGDYRIPVEDEGWTEADAEPGEEPGAEPGEDGFAEKE